MTSPIGIGWPAVSMLTFTRASFCSSRKDTVPLSNAIRSSFSFHSRLLQFGQREGPVVAAVAHAFEIDGRIGEMDGGDDDVVREERQHRDLEVDALERREVRVLRPRRVADRDARRGEARPWESRCASRSLRPAAGASRA